MKKIKNTKDLYKILIAYFISTIITGFVESLTIEYDYIPNKEYLYSLITFTLIFLFLINLFEIKFKSIFIFLNIIMFLLVFVLLNLDFFTASTPTGVFPLAFIISFYTTLPFQYVIHTLIGYRMIEVSYIAVPIYILTLILLCYATIRFNKKKLNNKELSH